MKVLRNSLRKVQMKRSPGGTPLDRTVQDTGTGLTPLMTRALKKKFQVLKYLSTLANTIFGLVYLKTIKFLFDMEVRS
jgi:hypothetical protein